MTAMSGPGRVRISDRVRPLAKSLSGRLLLLTAIYVMLGEVLIFVPSVGRYHRELLDNHIESAELAILPFTEPGGQGLSDMLRKQLLRRAGADVVTLRRADQRELFLVQGQPEWIDRTIDLTKTTFLGDMWNAIDCLFRGGDRMLQVLAPTRITGAQSVGIVLGEASIRTALMAYAERVIVTGLAVSLVTALLVFISIFFFMVRPMERLTRAMVAFRENPEDPSRIVQASARADEIGTAERELAAMQSDIYGFLQQKTRLAALGAAVARIQHDLRNILANAQLASDRLADIDDPVVKRLTPRLVASLDRAVSLATNTLRYGRADERPPQRKFCCLSSIIGEAGDAAIEARIAPVPISFTNTVDPALEIDADAEQIYRVALNLIRNAVEALVERGTPGRIGVTAARTGARVRIDVTDNGPGIPENLRARLFQPFATASRPGGSGLGLAIARDIARAHGGEITLVESGTTGTVFRVEIPDREMLR
jgi:signal transduction histidine kinase